MELGGSMLSCLFSYGNPYIGAIQRFFFFPTFPPSLVFAKYVRRDCNSSLGVYIYASAEEQQRTAPEM